MKIKGIKKHIKVRFSRRYSYRFKPISVNLLPGIVATTSSRLSKVVMTFLNPHNASLIESSIFIIKSSFCLAQEHDSEEEIDIKILPLLLLVFINNLSVLEQE